MDCSGLIYTSFKSEAISLPRTTKDLSITRRLDRPKRTLKKEIYFFLLPKKTAAK